MIHAGPLAGSLATQIGVFHLAIRMHELILFTNVRSNRDLNDIVGDRRCDAGYLVATVLTGKCQ